MISARKSSRDGVRRRWVDFFLMSVFGLSRRTQSQVLEMRIALGEVVGFSQDGQPVPIEHGASLELVGGPPLGYQGPAGTFVVMPDASQDPHFEHPSVMVYRNGGLYSPKGKELNLAGLDNLYHVVRVAS